MSIERFFKRLVIVLCGLCLCIAGGQALSRWAVDDAFDFYAGADADREPAYARKQPVADDFWVQQGADMTNAPYRH